MIKMQKDLEKKDSDIKLLAAKFATLEKEDGKDHISDLKKDLKLKNANIIGFKIRLEELEKQHKGYKKQQEKKL
jgi:hypothetical protein